LLRQGEEIQITKRRKVIGRLVPEKPEKPKELPDFLGRMREIFGDKIFEETGASIIARDRDRY
jgi:antitoxin (DNA-binding transcriptional repressor) of toxin-antitoxin stability system